MYRLHRPRRFPSHNQLHKPFPARLHRPWVLSIRSKASQTRSHERKILPKRGLFRHLPTFLIGLIVLGPFAMLLSMRYSSARVETIELFNNEDSVPFIVSHKDEASDATIYTLRPAVFVLSPGPTVASIRYPSYAKKGIWSVECKDTSSGISKSYIPLPPVTEVGTKTLTGDLRFLVSKNQTSQSSPLDGLEVGDQIDIGHRRIVYEVPDPIQEGVFLASGDGIAPALQVVDTLIEQRGGPKSKIHIIWVNQVRDDDSHKQSVMQRMLGRKAQASASPKLRVEELLHVEKYKGLVSISQLGHRASVGIVLKQILGTRVKQQPMGEKLSGGRMMLLSGDDDFVEYLTGSRLLGVGNVIQSGTGGLIERLGIGDAWTIVLL